MRMRFIEIGDFNGAATMRMIEVAMGRDSRKGNVKYYQSWLDENRFDPDAFVSNALKIAVDGVVRETHMYLPRARVMGPLYHMEQLLDEAYGEKVFRGSKITGLLSGFEYAKAVIDSRIEYHRIVTYNEISDTCSDCLSSNGRVRSLQTYAALKKVKQ